MGDTIAVFRAGGTYDFDIERFIKDVITGANSSAYSKYKIR